MATEKQSKSPSTRRYTPAEKEQAIRLVRQLRKELGTDQGAVARVASQLGYGVESVRAWVKQADIDDGQRPGTTSVEAERIKRSNRRTASSSARTRSCAGLPHISPRRSSTARGSDRRLHRRQPRRARGRAHLQGSAGGPEHVLRGEEATAVGPGRARRRHDSGARHPLGGQLQGLWSAQALEGPPPGRPRRRPGPGGPPHG